MSTTPDTPKDPALVDIYEDAWRQAEIWYEARAKEHREWLTRHASFVQWHGEHADFVAAFDRVQEANNALASENRNLKWDLGDAKATLDAIKGILTWAEEKPAHAISAIQEIFETP